MSDASAISVDCELLHPILTVRDVPASVKFYTEALGFCLGFSWGDPPRVAGVNLGSVSIHLRQGSPHAADAAVYFVVADVDALYAFHIGSGVKVAAPPSDQPWGLREYQLIEGDGYVLTFGERLPSREPKLEIERADVALRLEKRLAALLVDLASHKGMSLGECVEEIVLHSFETIGEGHAAGTASPHNARTLAEITNLKKKHGIDYDAHDGYRFIERP